MQKFLSVFKETIESFSDWLEGSTSGPSPAVSISAKRSHRTFFSMIDLYEAGFLISRSEDGSWCVEAGFLFEHAFENDRGKRTQVPFELPPMSIGDVYVGKGQLIARAFQLAHLDDLNDSRAVMFAPNKVQRFLFLSAKPDPWIAGLVEDSRQRLAESR